MQIHIIKHKLVKQSFDPNTQKVVIIDSPVENPHSKKVRHIFDLYSNSFKNTAFLPLTHNDYSTLTSIIENITDKPNTVLSLSIAWNDNIASIESLLKQFFIVFTAYSLYTPYPSQYPFTYSVSKYSKHNPDITIPVPDTYFHHLKGNSAIAPLATALFVSNQINNDSFSTIDDESLSQDIHQKPLFCKTCFKIIKDTSLTHCPHCNQELNNKK